uniref:Family with sequence similarity 53 member B n=1 Tax=Malurus cyaneus samueli TaxID=2593467 RepID=A0A8C5U248_9PASS
MDVESKSLSDPHSNPSAPPSKRQCRSLSFSDEMSACGSSWRPLGSKVWTPVEKRRCYSGGSVQRYSNGLATMQRSSSFSLPARSNPLCAEHPVLSSQPRKPAMGGQGAGRVDIQRSLSCSHDGFSRSEDAVPSASSTPASTPELGRRAPGLSRSRSQPCVLNDKKVGVKRRRPEELQEQRPSLDLAKMTQVKRGRGCPFRGSGVLCSAPEDKVRGCTEGQHVQRFHSALVISLLHFYDSTFPIAIIYSHKVSDTTNSVWDGDNGGSEGSRPLTVGSGAPWPPPRVGCHLLLALKLLPPWFQFHVVS